jgi:uncharacterized protein (DUF58 family)
VTVHSASSHRPTGRVTVLVLVLLALGNLAAVTGSAWFVLLAGAAAGLLVAGASSRARLDGLRVELGHPPRVSVGGRLATRITVVNDGTRPSSPTRLCLHTVGLADVVLSVGRLDAGDRTSVEIERPATHRAAAESATGHLVARPSVGVLAATRELVVADQVFVHPVIHERPDRQVSTGVLDHEDGRVVVGTAGTEILGVREWRPGDGAGRVHWRSTARTGRLTLLERGDVESDVLRLVLVGADRQPRFEEALGVAASICDAALAAGDRVSAVAWHIEGPVLGAAGSRGELLDWWSTVHDTVLPDPAEFGRMATAGFGPGDVLVACPADAVGHWLRAAAAHSPDLRLHPVLAAS